MFLHPLKLGKKDDATLSSYEKRLSGLILKMQQLI